MRVSGAGLGDFGPLAQFGNRLVLRRQRARTHLSCSVILGSSAAR
ncbi:MAG: hypothetical protein AVDCRST_MAG88-1877 [uncultured Thermomicrobiales bacterium]|uniref:Uncharacterized protein n=1 Tax=uncultured Thermomicrobiales bacterium TaxID=1645740 RepID=A0A6J4V1H2_9BACT|nr:MAG: hypothetical protein AVDCRST_MAG88-1877 [uncultured Thermomicrobiales bacterium]